MEFETASEGETQIVTIRGGLDMNDSTQFESHLEAMVENGSRKILVDLTELEFITSSGLRVLLATAKRLQALDGEISVFGPNQTVREIFEISGFSALLKVFDSRGAALREP